MLINHYEPLQTDPVLAIISSGAGTKNLQDGIYKIGHFGGSHWMPSFDHYPDLKKINEGLSAYGVCDYPDQILEKFPKLQESERKFLITVNQILKSEQPQHGGWRWHKWGAYIGDKEPQCEYLVHEPDIEEVWVYHIYELNNN